MVLDFSLILQVAPSVIKQGFILTGLIRKAVSKSDVKDLILQTETMLATIKKTKNLDRSSMAKGELDRVYNDLEDILLLGDEFVASSSLNFRKNRKLTRKIDEIQKNLERFFMGPLLLALLVDVNNLRSEITKNSQSFQSRQLPWSNDQELRFGEGPYFWIKTDAGIQMISKQYLGASDIWICTEFEGTVTQLVKFEKSSKKRGDLWAYTYLRVSIPQSKGNSRLILLNMRNKLADWCYDELEKNDRVSVFGHLETYKDDDENGNEEELYQVTVTSVEILGKRHSEMYKDIQSNEDANIWMLIGDKIQSLNKQNLGASDASVFASFEGTLTQPVGFKKTRKGRYLGDTILRVSIPRSNGAIRFIKLNMQDELAEWCVDNLVKNDRVHVSGELRTYTDADENGNDEIFFKVIVEDVSFIK